MVGEREREGGKGKESEKKRIITLHNITVLDFPEKQVTQWHIDMIRLGISPIKKFFTHYKR